MVISGNPMVTIDRNAKVIQTKWDNLYFIFLAHIKYMLFISFRNVVELRTFGTILLECFMKDIHFIQWEKS